MPRHQAVSHGGRTGQFPLDKAGGRGIAQGSMNLRSRDVVRQANKDGDVVVEQVRLNGITACKQKIGKVVYTDMSVERPPVDRMRCGCSRNVLVKFGQNMSCQWI